MRHISSRHRANISRCKHYCSSLCVHTGDRCALQLLVELRLNIACYAVKIAKLCSRNSRHSNFTTTIGHQCTICREVVTCDGACATNNIVLLRLQRRGQRGHIAFERRDIALSRLHIGIKHDDVVLVSVDLLLSRICKVVVGAHIGRAIANIILRQYNRASFSVDRLNRRSRRCSSGINKARIVVELARLGWYINRLSIWSKRGVRDEARVIVKLAGLRWDGRLASQVIIRATKRACASANVRAGLSFLGICQGLSRCLDGVDHNLPSLPIHALNGRTSSRDVAAVIGQVARSRWNFCRAWQCANTLSIQHNITSLAVDTGYLTIRVDGHSPSLPIDARNGIWRLIACAIYSNLSTGLIAAQRSPVDAWLICQIVVVSRSSRAATSTTADESIGHIAIGNKHANGRTNGRRCAAIWN